MTCLFLFNDTATTEIYTLSLHDALPISHPHHDCTNTIAVVHNGIIENASILKAQLEARGHTFRSETDTEVLAHLIEAEYEEDRKSTRLNSSHANISYAVFCLKKKNILFL